MTTKQNKQPSFIDTCICEVWIPMGGTCTNDDTPTHLHKHFQIIIIVFLLSLAFLY
jgi:hypothetical protein